MYSKQEASRLTQQFWTSFGQYLSPVLSAEGEKINWVNYKTGEKDTRFIMVADQQSAKIAIRFLHKDPVKQQWFYEKLLSLKTKLQEATGVDWQWQPAATDVYGKNFSEAYCELGNVNILNQQHWPAIISFFKPRLIALDKFWSEFKYAFQQSPF